MMGAGLRSLLDVKGFQLFEHTLILSYGIFSEKDRTN